jgi:hypothetical protein
MSRRKKSKREDYKKSQNMNSHTPLYILSHTPGALEKFTKKKWTFQCTICTPLTNLEPFVTEIVTALAPVEKGIIVIDGYVFEPKNLRKLLSADPQSMNITHNWSLESTSTKSMKELLFATLQDWIDFAFIPTPQLFAIYADHDEYTTFYAMTKSNLNRVVQPLLAHGFTQIKDFKRSL